MRIAIQLLLICISTFATTNSYCQNKTLGNSEISISTGFLTSGQLRGVFSDTYYGPAKLFLSTPCSYTGAEFLTFKQKLNTGLTVGITAGFESVVGDITYGPDRGPFGYLPLTSGIYNHRAATLAAEINYVYGQFGNITQYGGVGVGYSFTAVTYKFYPGIYEQDYFYGTKYSLVPTNPYTIKNGEFAYHIIFIGGKKDWSPHFSGYLEFGYGYKGIFSGGLGYRF